MSELKRYEVRITGYATVIVFGKGLSANAACSAAKADAEADGDFTVVGAQAVREVPDAEATAAIWAADAFLDLDPEPNPTGTGRRVL